MHTMYLDMLPTEFGNPLWYTTLHWATVLQKKTLKTLFDEKVKKIAEKLLVLDGNPERRRSKQFPDGDISGCIASKKESVGANLNDFNWTL